MKIIQNNCQFALKSNRAIEENKNLIISLIENNTNIFDNNFRATFYLSIHYLENLTSNLLVCDSNIKYCNNNINCNNNCIPVKTNVIQGNYDVMNIRTSNQGKYALY